MRYIIKYAIETLKNIPEQYVYHNYQHTIEVVRAAHEIGDYEHLSQHNMFVLLTACWFHDLGYIKSSVNQEEESKAMAKHYLKSHGYGKRTIHQILAGIGATKMPQAPTNEIGKIVCDANLFYLSEKTFWEKSSKLKKEMENIHGTFIGEDDWCKHTIDFMVSHQYFSNYGQRYLSPRKEHNMRCLGYQPQPVYA